MSYRLSDGRLLEPSVHYVGDGCDGGHEDGTDQRCICGHTSPEHPDDGGQDACGAEGCICLGWFGELWPLSDAERAELRDLDYGGVFAWFMAHERPAA